MAAIEQGLDEDDGEELGDIDLSQMYRVDGSGPYLGVRTMEGSVHIIDERTAAQEALLSHHRRWAGHYGQAWTERDEIADVVAHPETVKDSDRAILQLASALAHDHSLWVVAEHKGEHERQSLRAAPIVGGLVIGNSLNLVVGRRDGSIGRLDLSRYDARVFIQPHAHGHSRVA